MSRKNSAKSVYEYLSRINRPENIQGIINNLDDCKKADVTRALELLVEEGKVIEKISGKTKIYYVNQKELNKGIKEDVGQLDLKIQEKMMTLKQIENSIREKEAKLNSYAGKLSSKDLVKEIEIYRTKLRELETKLKDVEANKVNKENKYENYDYEKVSKECRKRRRITKDIIDAFEECSSKSKKMLLSEIGIEFFK